VQTAAENEKDNGSEAHNDGYGVHEGWHGEPVISSSGAQRTVFRSPQEKVSSKGSFSVSSKAVLIFFFSVAACATWAWTISLLH